MQHSIVRILLVLAAAIAVQALHQEHLPRAVEHDIQEALGSHFLAHAGDSIDVVPHDYFRGGASQPNGEDDRSLIHAAERITHHVDAEMEQLAFNGVPGLLAESTEEPLVVQAEYSSPVDPTFLVETDSVEQTLTEEEQLDRINAQARADAQEIPLGLLETEANVAPRQYVTPTYIKPVAKVAAPAAPAAPKKRVRYQRVAYKKSAAPTPAPVATVAAPAKKESKWAVAKTIPDGHLLDHDVGRAELRARARRAAKRAARKASGVAVPARPATSRAVRKNRYCVKRNQQTKKCERRCSRCTRTRWASPSFYQPVVAVPVAVAPAPRIVVATPQERHLVMTPQGPVYVLYVSKRAAPTTFQQVAFHANPRAVTQARRTTYRVSSAAAKQPTDVSSVRARRERAAALAKKHTQYDPKTNTIIKHIHHHQFHREAAPVQYIVPEAATEASSETLQRAYVKLCRLQKAIVAKYNNEARAAARWAKRRSARRANRRAFQTRFPTSAKVVARASGLGDKYSGETKAATLTGKYSAPEAKTAKVEQIRAVHTASSARSSRARQLIARAREWVERRAARRQALSQQRRSRRARRRQAKQACRAAAQANGRPIPERCRQLTSAERQAKRELRAARREARRLDREAKRAKRWAAKRACRRRFYLAGQEIPRRCCRTSRAERHARRIVRKARAAAIARRRAAKRAARLARRAAQRQAKESCRRRYERATKPAPTECQRASEAVRAKRALARGRRAARRARRAARKAAAKKEREARRAHRRAARQNRRIRKEALKKQCRAVARQAGKPIPSDCRTSKKQRRSICREQARAEGRAIPLKCREQNGLIPARVSGPRSPAAALVHQSNKSRRAQAKKKCRALARQAGVKIPRRCRSRRSERTPLSGKVFTKRYDEKTNRVRFAQQHAELEAEHQAQAEAEAAAQAQTEVAQQAVAEAQAAAQAEAVAEAESAKLQTYSPVDGLDYNQSPLIQALLKQLEKEKLVKL